MPRGKPRPATVTQCEIDECGRDPIKTANGLWVCNLHYVRYQRHRSFELSKSNAKADQGARGYDPVEHRLGKPDARNYSLKSQKVDIPIAEGPKTDVPLNDSEILERYGRLMDEFVSAVAVDASYTTSIISQARKIEQRQERKHDRSN